MLGDSNVMYGFMINSDIIPSFVIVFYEIDLLILNLYY